MSKKKNVDKKVNEQVKVNDCEVLRWRTITVRSNDDDNLHSVVVCCYGDKSYAEKLIVSLGYQNQRVNFSNYNTEDIKDYIGSPYKKIIFDKSLNGYEIQNQSIVNLFNKYAAETRQDVVFKVKQSKTVVQKKKSYTVSYFRDKSLESSNKNKTNTRGNYLSVITFKNGTSYETIVQARQTHSASYQAICKYIKENDLSELDMNDLMFSCYSTICPSGMIEPLKVRLGIE